MATTMHCAPNLSAHRSSVDGNLVGAGLEQLAHVVDCAHSAADSQGHEALFGGPLNNVEDGVAVLVAGRDVQKAKLVGTGRIIGRRGLHRIARVPQIDKIYALDDTSVFHIEAWDDADLQGHEIQGRVADGSLTLLIASTIAMGTPYALCCSFANWRTG